MATETPVGELIWRILADRASTDQPDQTLIDVPQVIGKMSGQNIQEAKRTEHFRCSTATSSSRRRWAFRPRLGLSAVGLSTRLRVQPGGPSL